MKRSTRRSRSAKNKQTPVLLILIGTLLIIGATMAVLANSNNGGSFAEPNNPANNDRSVVPNKVKYTAPALTLTDLNGQLQALSDYQGSVVLVNNWAIWCPPCKAEMPELQAFYQNHKDDGFVIVAINAGETTADVRAYANQTGLTFPIWIDLNSEALSAFKTNSLPSSFVIDREGVVRLAWSGAISYDMLETHVTPLITE